jgi:hypothetical protein
MNDIVMQQIAELAPDKHAFLVKTAGEVRESPFRDEILGQLDVIVKKAQAIAPPSMLRRFGNAAGGVAAMAATGIAYSLAGDMYDAVRRGISKSRNYRVMMRENPDLKDMPAKNVQKAFSTLHRFNPEFAGDPTVAGSFVRRQAQFPEFDTNQLANLVGARKNLSDLKKLPVPSKLPWETHDEKALRAAQTKHFQTSHEKGQKEIGVFDTEQLRRAQEFQMKQEEHNRRGEIHPFALNKAKQDVDQEYQAQLRMTSNPMQEALWQAQKQKLDRDMSPEQERRAKREFEAEMSAKNLAAMSHLRGLESPDKAGNPGLTTDEVDRLRQRAREYRR